MTNRKEVHGLIPKRGISFGMMAKFLLVFLQYLRLFDQPDTANQSRMNNRVFNF